jgi:hypothetical protein
MHFFSAQLAIWAMHANEAPRLEQLRISYATSLFSFKE